MAKLLYLIVGLTIVLSLNVGAIPNREVQSVEGNTGVLDLWPSREPVSPDDYYELGITYLRRGMSYVASAQFQKALELDPEHVDSLIGLAASELRVGNAEAALEYSSKAVNIKPNSARVRNAVGELQIASSRFTLGTDTSGSRGNAEASAAAEHLDKAEARFKEAISLDSKYIPAYMNLALVYIAKRKPEEAIREYKTVIRINPGNLAARRSLTGLYLNTGDLDKAIEEAEAIVKISSKDPISRNALGEIYMRRGWLDEASSQFQEAVRLDPKYAPGYKNIGTIYLMQGSPDRAIGELERALSFSPDYGEAHSVLGDIYLTKGMYQKAAGEYESAISKDAIRTLTIRSLISIYNNLAYIYAEEERNLDRALSFAQRAQQVAPTHPGIADTLGWVYYKKGNYSEAITNLEAAVKEMPDNPAVRYHLGAAYYKQGVKDKAAAELRKALSISESSKEKFEDAEKVEQLLTELEGQ